MKNQNTYGDETAYEQLTDIIYRVDNTLVSTLNKHKARKEFSPH